MKSVATLFAVLPALASFAPAQDAPKEPLVIAAGDTELPALIDRVAAYLDCNILWAEQDMQAAGPRGVPVVRLQRPVKTDRTDCLEVLAEMTERNGFVLTVVDEQKRIFEVVYKMGPRARDITARAPMRTPAEILARPALKMPAMTAVQLEHASPTVAINALRPFFAAAGGAGSSVTIGTDGNNAIVLTGLQDQIAQALQLLETCDVPPPAKAEKQPERTPEPVGAAAVDRLLQRLDELERRLEQRLAQIEKKLDGKRNR